MKNYYFVATALPPLQFGMPPEMSFQELDELLKLNLTPSDYALFIAMRRYYDILNIRAFWKGEELDPYGNLNESDLEESLLSREGLPEYVYEFLDSHEAKEQRLRYFPALIAAYFREEIAKSKGFLFDYLTFERAWRLVLTGARAKRLGKDIAEELQFEDSDDDLVAQIIAQKDAKSFVAPDGFQDLQVIFDTHDKDPLALHQALSEYRSRVLSAMPGVDLFSINRILSYAARLILAEKWISLDRKKGLEIADQVLAKAI